MHRLILSWLQDMVNTEDGSSSGDDWEDVFKRNRLVPPSCQSVLLAVEKHLTSSHGFQLGISRVTGPHLPQVTPCC